MSTFLLNIFAFVQARLACRVGSRHFKKLANHLFIIPNTLWMMILQEMRNYPLLGLMLTINKAGSLGYHPMKSLQEKT